MSQTMTRRAVLAGATALMPAAAVAATVPAVESATAATPTPWHPPGLMGIWIDRLGDTGLNRMKLCFDDWTYRDATPAELEGYLREHPFQIPDFDPKFIRAHFADEDGELFALMAELSEARRGDDREREKSLLERVCETPATTDVGAAHQLRLLIGGTYSWCEPLAEHQLRQLAWSACSWLEQQWIKDKTMERRAIDVGMATRHLRSYHPEHEKRYG